MRSHPYTQAFTEFREPRGTSTGALFESVLANLRSVAGSASIPNAAGLSGSITYVDGTTVVSTFDGSDRPLVVTISRNGKQLVKTYVYEVDGSFSWSYS